MSKNAWQNLGLTALAAITMAGVVWLLAGWPPAPPPSDITAAALKPPPPEPQAPLALVVGDSFAAGAELYNPEDAFPRTLAQKRDWALVLDAQPGTGYINPGDTGPGATEATGQVYERRVLQHTDEVDVAVFTGGYNDYWSVETGREPLSAFKPAVDRTLDAAEQAMPDAQLVVVGVWWPKPGPVPAVTKRLDADLQAAAAAHEATYVSGDWLHDADLSTIIGPDSTHPSEAGQDFIARQLAHRIPRVS